MQAVINCPVSILATAIRMSLQNVTMSASHYIPLCRTLFDDRGEMCLVSNKCSPSPNFSYTPISYAISSVENTSILYKKSYF